MQTTEQGEIATNGDTKRRKTIVLEKEIWALGLALAKEDRRDFSAELSTLIAAEAKRRSILAKQKAALAATEAA